MDLKTEITKAIAAHGMWKTRLRSAIDTGKSDFKVSVVQTDDQCDFGKWLKALPATTPHKQSVSKLHATFHTAAAGVLQLAVSGKRAEAEAAMGAASTFSEASSALTREMMEWHKAA